jgi:hypothetical protein
MKGGTTTHLHSPDYVNSLFFPVQELAIICPQVDFVSAGAQRWMGAQLNETPQTLGFHYQRAIVRH